MFPGQNCIRSRQITSTIALLFREINCQSCHFVQFAHLPTPISSTREGAGVCRMSFWSPAGPPNSKPKISHHDHSKNVVSSNVMNNDIFAAKAKFEQLKHSSRKQLVKNQNIHISAWKLWDLAQRNRAKNSAPSHSYAYRNMGFRPHEPNVQMPIKQSNHYCRPKRLVYSDSLYVKVVKYVLFLQPAMATYRGHNSVYVSNVRIIVIWRSVWGRVIAWPLAFW